MNVDGTVIKPDGLKITQKGPPIIFEIIEAKHKSGTKYELENGEYTEGLKYTANQKVAFPKIASSNGTKAVKLQYELNLEGKIIPAGTEVMISNKIKVVTNDVNNNLIPPLIFK